MTDIRLVATDLDGTLLGKGTSLDVFVAFRKQLAALRQHTNVVWAVSTGRSRGSFRRVFEPLQMLEIAPDYVILRHALIYSVGRWSFVPHRFWNLAIQCRVWKDRLHVRNAIDDWQAMILLGHRRAKTIEKTATRLWMRFETEEEAGVAASLLSKKAACFRHLQVFRYLREVDVRAVPYTKGLAVAELARHLGLVPSQVLVIGDGHNDTSMMDESVAGMCGCPSNAAPEVIQCVRARQGHVAAAPSLDGVLEILRAYESGIVCSDLPATWLDPALSDSPLKPPPTKPKKKRRSLRRMAASQMTLGVTVVVSMLLVAASFKLLPFSDAIMKPYRALETIFVKLLDWWMAA
jgi:hydroxymethylpyrimidine pyrophosphatase-like HAD family hydrolase